jgi:Mg-chelatase subunit ChlD
MRLEDLILLALRCLLLALLALGLARPALKSGDMFGQSKVTSVLIVDASYSMGASDGTMSRFEKAQRAALEVVDGLPGGSAAAVWLAGDGYQGVVSEPTFDLNLARKAIRDAVVSDRGTDLFPALRAAVATLRDRLAVRREIFLVTDGQALGWRQLGEIRDLLRGVQGEIGCTCVGRRWRTPQFRS